MSIDAQEALRDQIGSPSAILR